MELAVKVLAVASPEALVVAVFTPPAKAPLGPVAGAVKVTTTPGTGLPEVSFTVACRAVPKAVLMVALCGEPAVTVMVGSIPVPERLTDCGLSLALSLKESVAVRPALAAGVKVTLMAQVLPGATVTPMQVSTLLPKSPAFAPISPTLVIARLAVPLLVTVSVCAALVAPTSWLPKSRLVAEGAKAGAMPVPVRCTVWGLTAALSVNTTEAVRVPMALGVKVTLTVH